MLTNKPKEIRMREYRLNSKGFVEMRDVNAFRNTFATFFTINISTDMCQFNPLNILNKKNLRIGTKINKA